MRADGERTSQIVLRLLRQRAGLAIPASREGVVREATLRVLARSGVTDLDGYADGLLAGRVSLSDLLDEVTIGETYFFREPRQFAFLRDVALPALRATRTASHVMRLWSAACASGEEAYSLAILAADAGLAERTAVLGTDISRVALTRARAGIYGKWSMRDRGLALSRHHLIDIHGEARPMLGVSAHIRALVRFSRENLSTGDFAALAGPLGFDVILCRNVLIYFDAEAIARVAAGLYAALAPGGYLLLGSSDPPLGSHAPFEIVSREEGTFYRRRSAEDVARAPITGEFHVASRALAEPTPPSSERIAPASSPAPPATPAPPAPEADSTLDALAQLRGLGDGGDLVAAERAITEALSETPTSAELHHAHALVLGELGRLDDALASCRRALYLAPELVMAHLTQGVLWTRKREPARARASFRAVRTLCAALSADAEVPLSDGLTARYVAALAETHLR